MPPPARVHTSSMHLHAGALNVAVCVARDVIEVSEINIKRWFHMTERDEVSEDNVAITRRRRTEPVIIISLTLGVISPFASFCLLSKYSAHRATVYLTVLCLSWILRSKVARLCHSNARQLPCLAHCPPTVRSLIDASTHSKPVISWIGSRTETCNF